MTRKQVIREAALLAFVIAVWYAAPAFFGNPAPELWMVVLFAAIWAVLRFLMVRYVENRRRTTAT